MIAATLPPIANHLWQSTFFSGVAGLLTLLLRKNPARVRHWIWVGASLKFLVPFSLLVALGGHVHWRIEPVPTTASFSIVMDQVSQPFRAPAALSPSLTAAPPSTDLLPRILWTIWGIGFSGIACSWWLRWGRINAAVHAGSALDLDLSISAISSPSFLEPGVFGIFRPVLLLPEGIFAHLTPEQWKSVAAHELCHVRRRDNLIAVVQMFVETTFWFHPLVWWVGKRILEERERACDEEVLRLGSDPRTYAQGILKICELYLTSPVACVAGVCGPNLRRRIEEIMSNSIVQTLNGGKKLLIAITGALTAAVPIAVGVMNSSLIHAQPQATAPRPTFEVASVKLCKDFDGVPGGRGGRGTFSPGRIVSNCQSVAGLINAAYVLFAGGKNFTMFASAPIKGAPEWIYSERYTITAKAEDSATRAMMSGPMMQALLEDRFKLKIHRESREVPIYALTVAKGGSKLEPFKDGSCTPIDFTLPPGARQELAAGEKRCRNSGGITGAIWTVDAEGITLDQLTEIYLKFPAGRDVVNRTGINGRFNIHLKYANPTLRDGAAAADVPLDASIFTAVQEQLGLKLESAKGAGEYIVVDHVERPSEN